MLQSLHYDPPGFQQREADKEAVERLLLDIGTDDSECSCTPWLGDAHMLHWWASWRLTGNSNATRRHDRTPAQEVAAAVLDDLIPIVVRCLREQPDYVQGMDKLIGEWLAVPDAAERKRRRITVTDVLART